MNEFDQAHTDKRQSGMRRLKSAFCALLRKLAAHRLSNKFPNTFSKSGREGAIPGYSMYPACIASLSYFSHVPEVGKIGLNRITAIAPPRKPKKKSLIRGSG